ncbi:uncharacterized protein LOC134234314 isoform X2 [Saccostrea cucullata]|uniref:uncharacterized protein LOC134234314 isoform X2 n=1 Tax=Saccostrea cuccullata TaxID=36930 RepID=UPI002ED0D627
MTCNSTMESVHDYQLQQNILITVLFLALFTGWRAFYERIKRTLCHVTVVVIGGGPVGLLSAFLALKSGRASKIVIFEEKDRKTLLNGPYQLTFDIQSVEYLKRCGIDFDNIEGCCHDNCFTTKVGVFLEYILDHLSSARVSVRFSCKFDKETCKELDEIQGRLLVIACDGRNGQASRLLGLDEFSEQHSCNAYGAIAAIERTEARDVPTPEKRVHNLTFDLSAYGAYHSENDNSPGFSLKVFGNSKHRYISLAISKCESPVVKALRTILDRSMMRNIFLKCFNLYKMGYEQSLSESYALNHMKFSPRLFEIKLSQRCETVAYFHDCDTFVLAEGEAALSFNFHTGLDINPAIRGLMSLSKFIEMISLAETEHSISNALLFKMRHNEFVSKDLIRNGLREYMFS